MVIIDNISVNSNFDTGTFMDSFSVLELDNHKGFRSIQDTHDLEKKDFEELEKRIAVIVYEYLKTKKGR